MTIVSTEIPRVRDIKGAQEFFRWAARRMWPGFDPFAPADYFLLVTFSPLATVLYDEERDSAESFFAEEGLPLREWVGRQ